MKLISDFKQSIRIDKSEIGDEHPVFLVAEVGVTACGSVDIGKDLIDKCVKAGIDAVKFQTIDCDNFMADRTVRYKYNTSEGIKDENMYDMLKKVQFAEHELIELARYAKRAGIIFYLSVDTIRSVEWAENAKVPAYKIGSWDLRNYPLLEAVAKTKKPIQMDLGPVILGEIVQVLEFLNKHGASEVMLVHCSHAPTLENLNLNTIPYLKEMFNIPIGYSADTREVIPDIISIALGAKMIEKRITLDKNSAGHHHIKALEPSEFTEWANTIRKAELSLGQKCLKPSIEDLSMKSLYFTSVVASRDIAEGECISRDMLGAKRPGTGVSPFYIEQMIGKRTSRALKENEIITWEDWGNFR